MKKTMRLELERAGETIGGSHVYFMNPEATVTLPLGYWEELERPLKIVAAISALEPEDDAHG